MPSVEQLRAFIVQNPREPFPRYGLALELRNQQKVDEALAVFAELLRDHPDYVPQYLLHAQTLITAGRRADAKAILEQGREAATRKGDAHARGEIEGVLADLEATE
jgi:predicted Zn-dependent protease